MEKETEEKEGDKLLQRVYKRQVKGSRRSRRHSRHGSGTPSHGSGRRRHGSRTSQRSSDSVGPQLQRRRDSPRHGQAPLQVFPPRPPPPPKEEESHPKRHKPPEIIVTIPEQENKGPKLAEIVEIVERVAHEHPPPPKRHHKRHKDKTSDDRLGHGRRASLMLSRALRDQNEALQSDRPIQIKLTKSHAALRSQQRRRKSRREKWTKEEIDWEWKELLWRMNIFGRIYNGFADLEYRAIRFGYKYEGLLIPYIVIFLMFFLPFAMYWDYVAIIHYEVPNFTFIRRVGCITLVHFLAVLMNTYSYMLASLQNKRKRLRFILGIGMFVHPILFFLRCYFDKTHDAYTPEKSIYYDSYHRKVDDDPPHRDYLGHADRFTDDSVKFQSWNDFVEDRDRYFRLPLRQ